jgi:Putative MetA-pathway of phenol degradation
MNRYATAIVSAASASFALCAVSHAATAQQPPIEVNPNRPTFATPATTTQFGVAELEFGVQQSFLHEGSTAFTSPTLLKLGVAEDFEIRLSTDGLVRHSGAPGDSETGLADLSLGAQWCFSHHGPFATDVALQLTHKFPTASVRRGLGSGESDTSAAVFLSRDFGVNHVDVNVIHTWLGLPPASGGGVAHQPAWALSVSHNLDRTWSFGGEFYGIGGTRINNSVVSNLWYIAYKPLSRLVLDMGVDVGLSPGAERYSVLAGLTYGIGRFRSLPTAYSYPTPSQP